MLDPIIGRDYHKAVIQTIPSPHVTDRRRLWHRPAAGQEEGSR